MDHPTLKVNSPHLAICLLLFLFLVTSCEQKHEKNRKKYPEEIFFKEADFAAKLEQLYPAIDTYNKKKIRDIAGNMRFAYTRNKWLPLWVSRKYEPLEGAEKLIADLEEMKWDGLDPETYHLSAIRKLQQRLKRDSVTITDAIAFDTLLSRSYLEAAADLLLGRIVPGKVDEYWHHANDSEWTAPDALAGAGKRYVPLMEYRSKLPTYQLLRHVYEMYDNLRKDSALQQALATIQAVKTPDSAAMAAIGVIINKELPLLKTNQDSVPETVQLLKGYQYYFRLKQTGKADTTTLRSLCTPPDSLMKKLSINMERIRWMQQQYGDLYLVVDIPLMELFLRRNGADAMHMRVVVGKPARATYSFNAIMNYILINPPWGVPPTILKKDVLPGMQKSGKKYLAKKGLKAYDKHGKVVNASIINAKNYRRYSYKQAPGVSNSLGYVKFNLDDPFDIYLHDTPHRGDFGADYRALSSGCVRLQKPQDMAIYILSQVEKKDYTQDKLDSIIKTHKTRYEKMVEKIPVFITYLTAFEDSTGKQVRYGKDVYSRDNILMRAMGM